MPYRYSASETTSFEGGGGQRRTSASRIGYLLEKLPKKTNQYQCYCFYHPSVIWIHILSFLSPQRGYRVLLRAYIISYCLWVLAVTALCVQDYIVHKSPQVTNFESIMLTHCAAPSLPGEDEYIET